MKRKISKKQISALKYMIIRSRVASDLLKRILILLIERSGNMTRDGRICISAERHGYSQRVIVDAADGLQAMSSCNGDTHLGALVHLTGSKLVFSWHNTSTVDNSRPEKSNFCYTFWLAKKPYSKTARQIQVSRKTLNEVDISNSGLYPWLKQ